LILGNSAIAIAFELVFAKLWFNKRKFFMKTWKSYLMPLTVFLPLFSCLGIENTVVDQQNGINIDQEKPAVAYSWLIGRAQVKPEEVSAYEEKLSALINASKNTALGGGITLYDPSSSTYFLIYPMFNMQDWESKYNNLKQESDKREMSNHLKNFHFMLNRTLPDFSRVPHQGSLNKTDPTYAHIDIVELEPNGESRFIDLLKEWTSQLKTKAPDCTFFVHKILVGKNLPAYFFLRGDCINAAANNGALPIDKFLKDKQAVGPIVKKIDSFDLTHKPKLSTLPFPVNPPN
jgi:hypothetical protein